MQALARIATIVLLAASAAACSRTTRWVDVARGEDGSTTRVERATRHAFTGGELSQAARRWPAYYSLRATHPASGQAVAWDGSFGLVPVLLEFSPRETWLVAYANRCDAEILDSGSERFPYVFQVSVDGRHWKTVPPAAFPARFTRANLSSDWHDDGRIRQPDDIARSNTAMETSTGHHFSAQIPRSFAGWNYPHKDQPSGCS